MRLVKTMISDNRRARVHGADHAVLGLSSSLGDMVLVLPRPLANLRADALSSTQCLPRDRSLHVAGCARLCPTSVECLDCLAMMYYTHNSIAVLLWLPPHLLHAGEGHGTKNLVVFSIIWMLPPAVFSSAGLLLKVMSRASALSRGCH